MLVSENAYRRNYLGEWIKKPVAEVNNSSQYYLLIRCDECGKLFKTRLSNRNNRIRHGKNDLCNPCSKTGVRNSQYGKDRSSLLAHARSFQHGDTMLGKHHSLASRQKMSEIKAEQISNGTFNILANNRGRKLWYESAKMGEKFFADSALEMLRMRQLDEDGAVARWTKRHGIKVAYVFDSVARYCVPDFLIEYVDGTKVVEEVKGRITRQEIAKSNATKMWCLGVGLGYRLLTQKMLNEHGEYRKFLKGQ